MIPADKFILCYVTDRNSLPISSAVGREAALLERIRSAAACGVDWVELRERDLESRPLLELARAAVDVSRAAGGGPRILVNDRLDLALAAGAGGVHLAEKTSLPVSAVASWKRGARRADFLVGVSCHSREAAEQAARAGADYIFFGPVFATPSKAPFGAPQGLAKLAEICGAVPVPVVAIGGIAIENAAACRQAGASGIAAIGLFQGEAAMTETVALLRRSVAGA